MKKTSIPTIDDILGQKSGALDLRYIAAIDEKLLSADQLSDAYADVLNLIEWGVSDVGDILDHVSERCVKDCHYCSTAFRGHALTREEAIETIRTRASDRQRWSNVLTVIEEALIASL